MAQVRITDADGVERATIPLSKLVERYVGFNTTPKAEITVSRDDLNSVSGLQPGEDRVYIEEGGVDTFVGILQSPGRGGATATIHAPHAAAQYMERAEPVGLGQEKVAVDDDVLVKEAIDATPQVTAGTLNTVTASETYIFSGITQLGKAQKVASASGGELAFNTDLSVDYLEARGGEQSLTFADTGETGQTVDVSEYDEVVVELWGPGGADANGSGGTGGYLKARIDTSSIDDLQAYPGEAATGQTGGRGLYDGGDGAQNTADGNTATGGGGGASTSLTDGTGNELAHADGGGGDGDAEVYTSGGNTLVVYGDGGGGARGGSGGDGAGDGEGTGFGGDGGTDDGNGGDGGQEAVAGTVTAEASTTGGGNDGDGQIRILPIQATLSPANQSFVEDTFNVDRDGVTGNTTHLRVYGVGQGSSQTVANVVPDADSESYTNKVTYSHPTWSSGDDTVWARRTNKDLKNVSALQSWGQTLIADLQEAEIRVSTVVKGATVALGDTFHVSHPEEGVDDDLRATEVTRLLSSQGDRYEAVFSNYSTAHVNQVYEDHRDVGRYNQAFEGDLTQLTQGPGRGPVDTGHDYVMNVYYPDDVVHEVGAQILIKGLNFRAYTAGAASNGGSHSHSVTIPDHNHGVTVTVPDHAHSMPGTSIIPEGELRETSTVDGHSHQYLHALLTVDTQDKSTDAVTSDSGGGTTETTTNEAGLHTHTPLPGIIDWDGNEATPAHYPENVDVEVNGISQGYSLGDGTGEFQEVVDIPNVLTQGWNEIRLTSAGLGHLDATFSADLFRQSL